MYLNAVEDIFIRFEVVFESLVKEFDTAWSRIADDLQSFNSMESWNEDRIKDEITELTKLEEFYSKLPLITTPN